MAERKIWTAAEFVNTDWSAGNCINDLERRARGYNGRLRELLCTSAQRLRDAQLEIDNLHEVATRLKGEELPPILPAEREIEIMVNEGGPSNVDS